MRVLCLLALGFAVAPSAGKPADKKKSKPPTGSQKCEKGIFPSLVKDGAIPLCDAHYPDKKAKSEWLIMFYREHMTDLQEPLNRVAIDMGNEPPEKSKSLKKLKKQRQRIKDLAEKYEFEAKIPKKGLEDKGKEPLLKVGAVCCDCGQHQQEVCGGKGTGIWMVRPGKDDVGMPGGEDDLRDAGKIVTFAMGQLGFRKQAAEEEEVAPAPKETGAAGAGSLAERLEELKAKKSQAVADEDFKVAGKLKKEIAEVEAQIKKGAADLPARIEELKAKKSQAAADEDFELAGKLKKEIAALEAQLKKSEL